MQQIQAAGELMPASTVRKSAICLVAQEGCVCVGGGAQLCLRIHTSLVHMASSFTSNVILSEVVLN